MGIRGKIVEPVCEACLPYICAHWELEPQKRLEACKPLRDWVDQIVVSFGEDGYISPENFEEAASEWARGQGWREPE